MAYPRSGRHSLPPPSVKIAQTTRLGPGSVFSEDLSYFLSKLFTRLIGHG